MKEITEKNNNAHKKSTLFTVALLVVAFALGLLVGYVVYSDSNMTAKNSNRDTILIDSQSIEIMSPEGVSPNQAQFLGVWEGAWNVSPGLTEGAKIYATFAVKEILPNEEATVVYAWAKNDAYNLTAGFVEDIFNIQNNSISGTRAIGGGQNVTLTFVRDGNVLKGTYLINTTGATIEGVFEKVK